MIILKQKKIEFNSPHKVVFDRNELAKAILWHSKKPVAPIKHVFLHGRYYAVSIYDKKIHIHRLLMMYWLQRDLESTDYIHHKDENPYNNLKTNLELMLPSEHQSLHRKGIKLSEEHKRNIGFANKRRKGIKYKKHIHENPELLEVK